METLLSNGIVIRDNRNIGCGISIENNSNYKYFTLEYTFRGGFFINIKGTWLKQNELPDYIKELEEIKIALIEANRLI